MDKRIQWAISRILDRITPNFYGSVTMAFQAGKLIFIKTEETEKPEAD